MERNPEFYRPKEKDQAFHPQPGYPETFQYWHHEAILDNGYVVQLAFILTQSAASIWYDVCDPDGNKIHLRPVFNPGAVVASTEVLDLKVGDNRVHGKFPVYEAHFHSGDMGADLVCECITQGLMEPPDGIIIGREQCPATPIYFSLVSRPRCRFTGTLIIAGRQIPVKGEGYADHVWTNVGFSGFPIHCWYWGRIFLPKHTIVWWNTQLNQTFGYQRMKVLWALKGEKLFEYLKSADYYVESGDLEIDPETGVTYPRKMIFMIGERKIKGTATYVVKQLLYSVPFLHGGASGEHSMGTRLGYKRFIRYLSDCHCKFEIEGEKVEADTKEIHEVGV